MKTLKVGGVGIDKTIPDLVIINFELYANHKSHEKCTEQINDRIRYLYEDIIKADFQKNDLKNTFFSVETLYDRDKSVKVLRGFSVRAKFKIQFDYKKEKLSELILILESGRSNAELKISFALKDIEAIRNRVLESAVHDGKKRAEIIAKSSGIILGEIVNIDYNSKKIDESPSYHYHHTLMSPFHEEEEKNGIEIEPTEIVTTDFVNMLWEIK